MPPVPAITDFFPTPYRPGSNYIGAFTIGVSPIGSINPLPWQDTVLSQYANSPRLMTLIANFADYRDQTRNFGAFYDNIWNIDTAVGAGLDVWGRIVNISRVLTVDAGEYFGFQEALPDSSGFGQQPFYSGPPSTTNYLLSDDAYRQLILAKAAFNICDGSIPAINRLLMQLFPDRGNAYVQEGLGLDERYFGFAEAGTVTSTGFDQEPFYSGQAFTVMSMRYIFDFALSPVERAIVNQSGVLPTPCGVTAQIVINP